MSYVVVLQVFGLDDLSVTHVSGAEPVVRHTTAPASGVAARLAYGRLGTTFWNGANLLVNELTFLLSAPASVSERQLGFLVEVCWSCA